MLLLHAPYILVCRPSGPTADNADGPSGKSSIRRDIRCLLGFAQAQQVHACISNMKCEYTPFVSPLSSSLPLLVQVEQVGHDFYLFRDKYTKQVRVLYKRKNSGYGVIVPQLDD